MDDDRNNDSEKEDDFSLNPDERKVNKKFKLNILFHESYLNKKTKKYIIQ